MEKTPKNIQRILDINIKVEELEDEVRSMLDSMICLKINSNYHNAGYITTNPDNQCYIINDQNDRGDTSYIYSNDVLDCYNCLIVSLKDYRIINNLSEEPPKSKKGFDHERWGYFTMDAFTESNLNYRDYFLVGRNRVDYKVTIKIIELLRDYYDEIKNNEKLRSVINSLKIL
jgi:hypothetical protein